MRSRFILALLLVVGIAPASRADIVFVDANAAGGGDGTSWASAFGSIQAGIDAATAGDGVFVKAGSYEESITLRSGVFVFGGFVGTEATVEERDLPANETRIDVSGLAAPVRAVELNTLTNARLDGFTVTGGRLTAGGNGAGALVIDCDATVSIGNCRFVENETTQEGGGIALEASPITIENTTFLDNSAANGGGLRIAATIGASVAACSFKGNSATTLGGGIGLDSGSTNVKGCTFTTNSAREGAAVFGFNATATIEQSSFVDNTATRSGGGLGWYGAPLTLRRSIFLDNYGGQLGGGFEVHETDATIADCLVARNVADNEGGGIRLDDGTYTVTQCTVVENTTNEYGGGFFVGRGVVELHNTIIAGNLGSGIEANSATVLPGNCLFFDNSGPDFTGTATGDLTGAEAINTTVAGAAANVDGDPLFAAPDASNFHLLGGSPAIGTASAVRATDSDLDGLDRPGEDGLPDIGAYEFYDEVAPSVVSITLAGATPTKAATVQFVVRLDEAVTGLEATDFQLTSADFKAVSGATVSAVQGERDIYLVTVNTGTGDGTLRLDLVDDDSIVDLAGNPLGGTGAGNGSFTTGEAFEIDKTAPVLTLIGDPALVLEAGSFYVEPGVTAADNRDGDITSRIGAAGFVDIGVLGEYTVSYFVSDTAGNAAESLSRSVTIVDTIAPSIQLFGENPVTIAYGQPYEDAGAFAFDAYDGDLSADLQFIPPAGEFGLPGNYEFIYRVADGSGNIGEAVRALVVVDDTAPIITLTGDARVEVLLGESYTDAGATATDNVDGDITGRIVVGGSLDTSIPGEYPVTYSVSDTAGNSAVAVRVVVVLDRPDFFITPEFQAISSVVQTVAFDVYNRSNAAQPWAAEVIEGGDWCVITSGATGALFYGQIFVEAAENTTGQARVAKIQISTADKFALPRVVQVSQAPAVKGGVFGCGSDSAQGSPWGDVTLVALLATALAWRARTTGRAE